ncbi:MAG: hypothetical protein RLZZ04_1466 [Cyanobacteriota bacterium]
MYDQKLIWLSFLVVAEIIMSGSVMAETNQSDTSGGQTYSSPTVSIDSQNGNGIPPTTQFNPNTGEVVGGGITNPIRLDNPSDLGSGVDGAQPREVTLNDVAEALETGLDKSLESLATAENNVKSADAGPRKIVRRSGVEEEEIRTCINPVDQARDGVRKQLFEAEKFIKQVNQIEPQKNIW